MASPHARGSADPAVITSLVRVIQNRIRYCMDYPHKAGNRLRGISVVMSFDWLNDFLNSEEAQKILLHPQFIAFFLTILLEIFRRAIVPKARIIWGTSHGFNFLIPQNPASERAQAIPNLPVNTKSFFVRNEGRGPAKNVEFYFNYKPEHYEVWPVIQHNVENAPDGRFVIRIPFIRQKEFFSIEAIHSNNHVPDIVNVRAEEGKCKEVNMAPVKIFPNWGNMIILAILIAGIFQFISLAVYIILKFLGF